MSPGYRDSPPPSSPGGRASGGLSLGALGNSTASAVIKEALKTNPANANNRITDARLLMIFPLGLPSSSTSDTILLLLFPHMSAIKHFLTE